jgi:hypothetical protein
MGLDPSSSNARSMSVEEIEGLLEFALKTMYCPVGCWDTDDAKGLPDVCWTLIKREVYAFDIPFKPSVTVRQELKARVTATRSVVREKIECENIFSTVHPTNVKHILSIRFDTFIEIIADFTQT